MIRTLTGITYGDGYEYSNSRGEIIGRYADIKEGWRNYQEYLLMKSEILMSALEKNQYEIFGCLRYFGHHLIRHMNVSTMELCMIQTGILWFG